MASRGNPTAGPLADEFASAMWEEHVRSLFGAGLSHGAIAEELNRRCVPTAAGKKWLRQTVTRLVKRVAAKRESRPDVARGGMLRAEPEHLFQAALHGDEAARSAVLSLLGSTEAQAKRECGFSGEFADVLRDAVQACDAKRSWDREDLLRKAAGLGSCEYVQALGITAQAERIAGNLGGAAELLAEATRRTEGCRSCHADLHRRRAVLCTAEGDYSAGLAHAEKAIKIYEELGHSGHDLAGAGIESTILARGQLRYFLDEFDRSVLDFESCLRNLCPDTAPELYCVATHALAVALKECGPEGQRKAVALLREVRLSKFMRGDRRKSSYMAYIDWLDGSLKWVLNIRPRIRAVRLLEHALAIFVDRDMSAAAVAVLADLSRMRFQKNQEIRSYLADFRPAAHRLELSLEVKRALSRLWNASSDWRARARPALNDAIVDLRQAAEASKVSPQTPGPLPCLIP